MKTNKINNSISKLLTLFFITFSVVSFTQNKTTEEMEWLTTKAEFDGMPLYLRLPNYKNIWDFQSKYPNLICISHELDSVKENGLPTNEYNESLFDFDGEVVNLFDEENIGIIFLVETFGGSRNYWFYTKKSESLEVIFDKLKKDNISKKLSMDISTDDEWNFIKEYPVKLYKK